MQRLRLIAAVAVAVGLLGVTPARAQSTATLQGTVTDPQNAVMPGVSITVHNTATDQDRVVVTDAAGEYVAAALAPGHYEVSRTSKGFRTRSASSCSRSRRRGREPEAGVGALSENVTVTGSSPLIETATVSVGQVMAERTVQEIPLNGRHFVDLGPLMPGGVTAPQNAGLERAAARPGRVLVHLGRQPRDLRQLHGQRHQPERPVERQVTFQPSINTVSEFKVDNSTFSAEYGRNSGAIVNVATRSGSNALHGEAFDFYRDDKFDSRNYFNPRAARRKSPFNRKQFGFNLGGPIVKNRTFYFFSYEGLRHIQGVDLNSGTLTAAQRAAVTDPVSQKLLQFIPLPNTDRPTARRGFIASARRRSTSISTTIDVRHNMGKNDDLHGYYAFQARSPAGAERAGQHRARLRRHARRPSADHDGQRDPRLQPGAGQRSAGRLQPPEHHISTPTSSSTRPTSASTSASTGRSRCRRSRFTGLGLNFGGPVRLPERPHGLDARVRRHGDVSARQSHHQVRRRVPAGRALQLQPRSRHVHLSERGGVSDRAGQCVQHHAWRSIIRPFINAIGGSSRTPSRSART